MPQILVRQLEQDFEAAIVEAEEEVLEEERTFAEQIYSHIQDNSPFLTGYYKANHRILIEAADGSHPFGLTPEVNPADPPPGAPTPGMFKFVIQGVIEEELEKLDLIKLGDIVIMVNAIEYADEVERNYGVYAGARALAG